MLARNALPTSLALTGALLVPLPAAADRATPNAARTTTGASAATIARKPRTQAKRVDQSAPKTTGRVPLVARPRTAVAHFAGDPSDTISDFVFTPSTITVHVGETVTWTNNGPTVHTATANDGSFDTGTLQKGQSASHTFTRAGTFAYICSIHPFMHGTVVVLGNVSSGSSSASGRSSKPGSGSGSSGSTAGSGTSSATSAAPTASSSGASLPNTGSNLLATILTGAVLASGGLVLRRRLGARSSGD